MKKLISAVLCVMMMVSLFAMNASASVAIGDMPETLYPIDQDFEDAENLMFTTNAWPNGSGAVAVETVDGNSFADIYLGGKLDETLDIAYIGSGNLDGVAPNEGYTMTFDVYPVDTSVSLRVLHNNDVTNGTGLKYGFVIPASVFPTMNQWYSVKVVVAETFINQEASIAVYVKSGNADYTKITHTALYSPVMLGGNSFFIGAETRYNQNNAATVDNTRYKIDNIALSYRTAQSEYPSTGVLAYENYEGATASLKGQKAAVAGVLGDYYLTVLNDEDADSNGTAGTYAGSNMWTINNGIPEEFVVTFDLCQNSGNVQDFRLEYYDEMNTSGKVADHWGQLTVSANNCEVGKWYRIKAHVNCGVVETLSFVDLATGNSVEDATVTRATADVTSSKNGLSVRPFNNQGVFNWSIDNIVLTEAAAVSLPSITVEDDAVSVEISADAISAKVAPILALYNGNILVDVDWDAVDVAADGATAELEVSGEYDEAKIFLWDKFENGTPLLINPWDITEIIAE